MSNFKIKIIDLSRPDLDRSARNEDSSILFSLEHVAIKSAVGLNAISVILD